MRTMPTFSLADFTDATLALWLDQSGLFFLVAATALILVVLLVVRAYREDSAPVSDPDEALQRARCELVTRMSDYQQRKGA